MVGGPHRAQPRLCIRLKNIKILGPCATHVRIDRSRWYGARLTSANSLPGSDDQVVARNSSRSTRRSVASSGSFLRLACSRNAALIRLW
jgi:hypothetical protein